VYILHGQTNMNVHAFTVFHDYVEQLREVTLGSQTSEGQIMIIQLCAGHFSQCVYIV